MTKRLKPKLTQEQFLDLRDKWYTKLANQGFEDIEDVHSPNEMLLAWHASDLPRRMTDNRHVATVAYYEAARDMLNWYTFKNRQERRIWELHAEGISIREIVKRTSYGKRDKVHTVIKKIRREIKCPN